MNSKNELKLAEAAPLLYRDLHGDCTKTCMAFGFECGDGWFPLLMKGSRRIEEILNQLTECPPEELPAAMQVKEKFGTLRFYMTSETDEIHQIIAEMEAASETTCEVCGGEGTTRGNGWITTRCDTCEEKING
jgi:hypothetical protein